MSCTARLAGLLLLAGSAARAQGFPPEMFGPLAPLPGPVNNIVAPLMADLDADDRPDVIGWTSGFELSVVMNLGSGTFSQPSFYPLPDTLPGPRLLAGDMDLDGDLDVLSVGQAEPDQLHALPGEGTGALLASVTSISPTNVGRIGLGDVDGDGIPDAVYATISFLPVSEVRWQRGTGDLGFEPFALVTTTETVEEIELADLDLDGLLDIAASVRQGLFGATLGVTVVRSLGAGAFEAMPQVPLSGTLTPSLEISDLDRDGWPDLLVQASADVVRVAPGVGGALFGPVVDLPVAVPSAAQLWAVDLDVDGYEDVLLWGFFQLAAQRVGPELSVLGEVSAQPLVASRASYEVADLDGDGVPEPLFLDGSLPVTPYSTLGPVIDLGFDFPAGAGPTLVVSGEPLPRQPMSCELLGPAFGTPALLVLGLQPAHLAVLGGTLVPAPEVILPLLASQPLEARWPADHPSGMPVYLQAWLPGPQPAASNAFVVFGQ